MIKGAEIRNWNPMIHLCIAIGILAVIGIGAVYISSDFPETIALHYSESQNWYIAGSNPESEVDVFYLYPDVDVSSVRPYAGNVDVANFEIRRLVHDVIQPEYEKYEGKVNAYIPYYRQKTFAGTTAAGALSADTIAYSDVKAAFHQYMAVWNQGRPYILAGSGQGADFITRMAEEWVYENPLYLKNLRGIYLDGVLQEKPVMILVEE